jgi:hypothetical protein
MVLPVIVCLFISLSCDDISSVETPGVESAGSGEVLDSGATGDSGGVVSPSAPVMGLSDVKVIINDTLQNVELDDILAGLGTGDQPSTFSKPGMTLEARVSLNPLKATLKLTLDSLAVMGGRCALSGVMTVDARFAEGEGTYLLTINTPEGAPLTVLCADCGESTIDCSGLSVLVTFRPFSASFTGTVFINGEEFTLAEFLTPEQILATLTGALGKLPWEKLVELFQGAVPDSGDQSGSPTALFGAAATGYTVPIYNRDGLKVAAGIASDWSGIVMNITFTGYSFDQASSIALNGTVNAHVSFTNWYLSEVKIVLNTPQGTPLRITGIPLALITPTIGLADVTLYYNIYSGAIVDRPGDNGRISLNGLSFPFDPGWIQTIMDLLQM